MGDTWRRVKIGEVSSFKAGVYVAKDEYVPDGGVPIFGSNSIMGELDHALVEAPHSVMAAVGANAGAVRFSPGPSWVNNNAFAIVGNDETDPFYLSQCIAHQVPRSVYLAGTGQPYVRRKALASCEIELPPLREQRCIADLLTHVDEVIAKGREAQASLIGAYSIMLDALIESNDYPRVKLGDHLRAIEAGRSPAALDRPPSRGERGVLKVSAVRPGLFCPEESKALTSDTQTSDSSRVKPGDLLMTRANTRPLVGAVCLVQECDDNLYLSDKTLRLRTGEDLVPAYAEHALAGSSVRNQIEESASGTSASMKNISQAKIRELRIALPETDEQLRIAAVLGTIVNAIQTGADRSMRSNRLRAGLLSVLVSGQHEIPESYDRFLDEAA